MRLLRAGEAVRGNPRVPIVRRMGACAPVKAAKKYDIVLTAQGPAPTLNVTSFSFGTPPGGAAGNQVTATVTGPASTLVKLEASTDLQTWRFIASATTSGAGIASFIVTDSLAGDRSFYRFTIP